LTAISEETCQAKQLRYMPGSYTTYPVSTPHDKYNANCTAYEI